MTRHEAVSIIARIRGPFPRRADPIDSFVSQEDHLRQLATFIALVVLAGLAGFYSLSPKFPVAEGLDLQGGMRVTLEPDTNKIPPGQPVTAVCCPLV